MSMLYAKAWDDLRRSVDLLQGENSSICAIQITDHVCELLIAGEDHRYYRHNGVDLIALCRASYRSLLCGKREGGSTIAMQLVRTLTGRYEKSILRKVREVVLAVRLTSYLEPQQIPVLYLRVAYYGARMNNLRQACRRLSLKERSLSEYEAASLVARLKYPQPEKHSVSRTAQIHGRSLHLIALRKNIQFTDLHRAKYDGSISSCNTNGWAN